jgi:Rab3 GTPase-activating protein regulatory subunit N-terminus
MECLKNENVCWLFTGYRDAQVGWVTVTEDNLQDAETSSHHKDLRRALFIVIYAPRRGLLEVKNFLRLSRDSLMHT